LAGTATFTGSSCLAVPVSNGPPAATGVGSSLSDTSGAARLSGITRRAGRARARGRSPARRLPTGDEIVLWRAGLGVPATHEEDPGPDRQQTSGPHVHRGSRVSRPLPYTSVLGKCRPKAPTGCWRSALTAR